MQKYRTNTSCTRRSTCNPHSKHHHPIYIHPLHARRTTILNARPSPHIRAPHTCQTLAFASRSRIAIPSHFKTHFPSKHAMPTSRHCCHNLYLAQHDILQLHIVGRYMQVNSVQVPNICNTVLYDTRHAPKANSSTYSYAPSQTLHPAYN